jgi:uncharacterized protein with von Willebrand factor type A (vWA) domain
MYPFGDLPGNLAAFCGRLRQQHGFRLGPGELRDAARALDAIDVSDERHVRDALRTILSSSRDTALTFDEAFDRFFFPGPAGAAKVDLPEVVRARPAGRDETTDLRQRSAGAAGADTALEEDGAGGTGRVVIDEDAAPVEEQTLRIARASYSPLEPEGRASLHLEPVSPAWRDAARALVRRLHLGLSRRWRPARRGRRFDLRRTWRASLQTGGEALTARWLRRVRRSPRLVLLVDGSRSMGRADTPALELAVALASVTARIEVFAFSTALEAITNEVGRAAAGRVVDRELARDAWGGGTNIGASLRLFLRRHGERHVGPDTLIIILSDGLDVGDPGVLRAAMRELHRRAAGVVWLNPLLETPGFEPTSRGMVAAWPFISTFGSVSAPAGLTRLSRRIRLR